MSQIREKPTNHNICKPWKTLFMPSSEKELLSPLVKRTLTISVFMSMGFIFFTVFSNQSRLWFTFPVHHIRNYEMFQKNVEQETNISHVLFGIGGSMKTWDSRSQYTTLWWKPNVTRGFVWLDEQPPENFRWPDTSPPYKVSEDTSRFTYTNTYGSRSAIRIARIVLESYRLGLSNVRWFVMGDDDTVFFTENLVSVLRKYDHNEMYYIGGNSESVEQDVIHSYGMAYGGGGFAISYPLVAELVKLLDRCIDRYSYFYGSDERIGACMAEIGVPVTRELGFHQVDIRKDTYGLLAAHPLAPLVTLHHLDYVKPLNPSLNQFDSLRSLMNAYQTDPGRTLQQSFCYDLENNLTISVSWGYTVQIYPKFLTAKDIATPVQTFKTWKSLSDGPFTFNTRFMEQEPCERPAVFFLNHVEEFGMETQTKYKKFTVEDGKECDRPGYVASMGVKGVKVSSSKMMQNDWKKGQRRQCCEIVKHSQNGNLKLRIRRCKTRESVTIP